MIDSMSDWVISNGQQLSAIVKGLATGIKPSLTTRLSLCKGCVEGKLQSKPFKTVMSKQSARKLELVREQIALESICQESSSSF